MALHSALRHSLQAALAQAQVPGPLTDEVPALFMRVAEMRPELPQVGGVIEQLETLRWKYLAKQLSLWPVHRLGLSALAAAVLGVIARVREEDALLVGIRSQCNDLGRGLVAKSSD